MTSKSPPTLRYYTAVAPYPLQAGLLPVAGVYDSRLAAVVHTTTAASVHHVGLILLPDGSFDRVGCYCQHLPIRLRGELVRANQADFIRLCIDA